jgi:hypothetical protein
VQNSTIIMQHVLKCSKFHCCLNRLISRGLFLRAFAFGNAGIQNQSFFYYKAKLIQRVLSYFIDKRRPGALMSFITLSEGYYRCDRLSSSHHRLLTSPRRCDRRRNAGGGLSRRLQVKHGGGERKNLHAR